MRLRNIPGSREIIAESPYCIKEDTLPDRRGSWQKVFGKDAPICLEIGMGKGQFLTQLAQVHPDVSYLGIEKYSSVLLRALEKREQLDAQGQHLENLFYIRMDAEHLTEFFAPEEVTGIYLNFSDPWPKDRHAHRRLPGPAFLKRYEQILKPEGFLEFKTDNDDLFRFALESVEACGWNLRASTWDLHHDPVMLPGNIMTEYEERFSEKGNQIHKLIAQPRRGQQGQVG